MVMRNPKLLSTNESVPHDIRIVPTVSVIGQTKTGKTTLSQSLAKKLGMVVVTIEQILSEFCQEHHDSKVEEILNFAKTGRSLTDEMLV